MRSRRATRRVMRRRPSASGRLPSAAASSAPTRRWSTIRRPTWWRAPSKGKGMMFAAVGVIAVLGLGGFAVVKFGGVRRQRQRVGERAGRGARVAGHARHRRHAARGDGVHRRRGARNDAAARRAGSWSAHGEAGRRRQHHAHVPGHRDGGQGSLTHGRAVPESRYGRARHPNGSGGRARLAGRQGPSATRRSRSRTSRRAITRLWSKDRRAPRVRR